MKYIALLLTLALTACFPWEQENASTYDKVVASYETAQAQIDIYTSLPACGEGVLPPCHDPAVIAKIERHMNLVGQQIALAEAAIQAGEDPTVAERRALTALATVFSIFAAQALATQK